MDRHQAAVMRFCITLTGNPADAEDILQETFLTAWRKADSFEGTGSTRSWLFTIARRKLGRSVRRQRPEAAGDTTSLEELGARAGWGRGATGESARTIENRALLAETLGRLREDDRQVLLLRDVEGFSAREAAEILGVGVPALKSRLHRARLQLAGVIERKSQHAR